MKLTMAREQILRLGIETLEIEATAVMALQKKIG